MRGAIHDDREDVQAMMTLDEAIEHAEWCAENSCGECADDHAQLADWLRELRRARMEIDLLKTLRDGFKADAQKYKAENAKLRSERDHWHVEQVHAYGNWEDTHKYAAKLKAENDELRELCRDMFTTISWCNLDCYPSDNKKREYVDRLRELGIEVDE
jgi:chromosome segregation ATPase